MCLPDYDDLFDRHDAEQEDWLDRRPKCEECGHPIQDEYLFEIDGNLYCESCVKVLFRKETEDYERGNM